MMSGQSVLDRVQAARHSVMGTQVGKKVCKATTEELLAPKRKHLEDLLQYTHDPNVNVTDIIDYILSRTHNNNWVVVFKSLITLHHLMCYGNEKIIQNMASRTMELNLANYYDRKDMMGSQMSPFIQRYSKYLSTKAGSYRSVAFDFCNAKRGRDEGRLRNMDATELLTALPALADQLDSLLAFNARPTELQNGIIVAAFMLLFKDCIRLFASYNEGIINLLEKFFDMSKKQCEEALKDYKMFLKQMDSVGTFLKTAEEYGIDKGDIPDLTSAPNSLLEALESHYQSLEGEKKSSAAKKQVDGKKMQLPKQLSVNAEAFAAVSQKPQSNNPFFFDEGENVGFSEQEKQRALEEENQQLSKYSANKQQQGSNNATNPFATSPNSSSSSNSTTPAPKKELFDPFEDLLGGGVASNASPTSAPPSMDPFGGVGLSGGNSGSQPNSFSGAFSASVPAQSSNPFLQQVSPPNPMSSPYQQPSPFMASPQNMWMNDGNSTKTNPFGGKSDSNGGDLFSDQAAATDRGAGKLQKQQPNYNIELDPELVDAGNAETSDTEGYNRMAAPGGGFNSQPMFQQPQNNSINFDTAFSNSSPAPSANGMSAVIFGDVMQPTRVGGGASPAPMPSPQPQQRVPYQTAKPAPPPSLGNDLDSALANLSMSLGSSSTSNTGKAW